MSYEVVLGRNESDRKRLGLDGCVLLGKHYVKMGQTSSLSNEIWLDVSRSHVVFLCGKRGSGKSYSLAVVAEGISSLPDNISKNLAVIIMDTMGIYWTMKYPNQKDRELLDTWGMHPQGLDVKVYYPQGLYNGALSEGIPVDAPFAIAPHEIDPGAWGELFGVSGVDPIAIALEQASDTLKGEWSLEDFAKMVEEQDLEGASAAKNLIASAQRWGLFAKSATPLSDIVSPGQVTVLDVSAYATSGGSANVRALVIGLIAQKLFVDRMIARKKEEHDALKEELSYQHSSGKGDPVVWMLIDEAHEFLPREGKTPATDALVTLLREGRQPGVSLVLATQQPGKIHTDVMTQSDIVISHRITAKADTDALAMLTQSYMRGDLDVLLNELPREKGAAIVLDDNNEKLYSMRVRPRFSWHGGSDPDALAGRETL